jgi:hypothetical protein
MSASEIQPAPPPTTDDYIRRGQRIIAAEAMRCDWVISDLVTAGLGKMPPGVDARTVVREAFLRLRKKHWIRRETAIRSPRRKGGWTSLWSVVNRHSLAAWLKENPPAEGEPPTIRQMNLPFDN